MMEKLAYICRIISITLKRDALICKGSGILCVLNLIVLLCHIRTRVPEVIDTIKNWNRAQKKKSGGWSSQFGGGHRKGKECFKLRFAQLRLLFIPIESSGCQWVTKWWVVMAVRNYPPPQHGWFMGLLWFRVKINEAIQFFCCCSSTSFVRIKVLHRLSTLPLLNSNPYLHEVWSSFAVRAYWGVFHTFSGRRIFQFYSRSFLQCSLSRLAPYLKEYMHKFSFLGYLESRMVWFSFVSSLSLIEQKLIGWWERVWASDAERNGGWGWSSWPGEAVSQRQRWTRLSSDFRTNSRVVHFCGLLYGRTTTSHSPVSQKTIFVEDNKFFWTMQVSYTSVNIS